jgi:hypothetical protein
VNDNPITIRLSADEFALLTEVLAKDKTLAGTLEFQADRSIQVLPKNAEHIRDFLTLQLATTGFDQDYAPNEQGRLIESLIDRLYVP